MEPIILDIKSESERFEEHLNLLDNNQIIFSGIFGSGKTYFLNEFFKSTSDKYDVTYLSPVNYVVSHNEDIFEYIKYDIAFELFGKDIAFEKLDLPKFLTAQVFTQENYLEIAAELAKHVGKIGKTFNSKPKDCFFKLNTLS